MYPTIQEGDLVFVNKLFWNIKKEDLVAFKKPDENKIQIKRVKATEEQLANKYGEEIIVPRGNIWVVGDNRGNSIDSRSYGPISLGLVVGKVWKIYSSKKK